MAAHADPDLINPWGISFSPGAPFLIANNNSGISTLYGKSGAPLGSFTIPSPERQRVFPAQTTGNGFQ